jgi:predicted nucleotidyltransferase
MCTNQELHVITESVVKSVMDLSAEKIHKMILYGSYARGDFNQDSDIDIMIILNCTKEDVLAYRKLINKLASRIGLEHDIMLSVLLRDKESFYQYKEVLPFYQNISKEGVELYTKKVPSSL